MAGWQHGQGVILSPASMTFRFNAKRLFATYPQANTLTKEEIYEFYKQSLLAKTCIIGEETHADSGRHFHVYVEWERPYCTRSARCFDIRDYHPNCQSVRNKSAVINYVTKEDNTFGDTGDVLGTDGERALADAETADEFWAIARRKHPRDYVVNLEKLEYFVSKKFKQDPEPYRSEFSDFNITDELTTWINDQLNVRYVRLRSPLGGLLPPDPRLQSYTSR